MPKIKPFQGIHPPPQIAGKVTLQLENLSLDKAKSIRQENPYSYINMLVPKVVNHYLRGSRKELAYKTINENFVEFIEQGILVQDHIPSVYAYEVQHNGLIQKGIWTITSIDDYLDNTVKKHELTREDREKGLIEYLRQTGIDANPVLITHLPDERITRIMDAATVTEPVLDFASDEERHRLWRISEPGELETLVRLFAGLGATYIADGHHRAAAACGYGIERRKLNLKHRGNEEYNFFTSVYMATDQLKIYAFHRLVKDLGGMTEQQLLEKLLQKFNLELSPANEPVEPRAFRSFGMYCAGKWYRLSAKDHQEDAENPVSDLDVSILQNELLGPVLHIHDPRTDQRLRVMGGLIPVESLAKLVDTQEYALAFTLFPTSIGQLIRVADAGEVMPPKSTWFEPKFRAGLLIHRVEEW